MPRRQQRRPTRRQANLEGTGLRFGAWVRFKWRTCEVEFADFPGLIVSARPGREFNERVRTKLAVHIEKLLKAGGELPTPAEELEPRAGQVIRWFELDAPEPGPPPAGGAERSPRR